MAPQALGVLPHVAALRAGLRGGQEVGESSFLAPHGGLCVGAVRVAGGSQGEDGVGGARGRHPDGLVEVTLLEPSLKATGEVGTGRS